MRIVISSGHGKYIRGASGSPAPPQLDEVDEARKVVERVAANLRSAGVDVITYHDDVSDDQSENLNRIVDFHNSKSRELDVSIHFNAYDHSAHGVEVLYVSQQALAAEISAAIAAAGPFTDRGAKKNTGLYFLNNTSEPAVLIETCFCDNTSDSNTYNAKFNDICLAIAEALCGEDLEEAPPPESGGRPDIVLPRETPITERPVLSRGDEGWHVEDLQRMLPRFEGGLDGDFGPVTEDAVLAYQGSRGLDVDGVVGEQTWTALYDRRLPVPRALPPPLSEAAIADIREIAAESEISDYEWDDRGVSPEGYVEGFALSWANVYRKFKQGYAPAVDMAKADTGDDDHDVLAWYAEEFAEAGMSNARDGADTLRHLYALLYGLGMRESSGQHCCGRDQSADNTSSETAEAGLYQTSWNAHNGSSHFDTVFADYNSGGGANPQGFLEVFSEDVDCSSADWDNYGSGDGERFQWMCKNWPAFAVETAAVTLRHLRQHYGPINRKEAELRKDSDRMLLAVQHYIDARDQEAKSEQRRPPLRPRR